MVRAIEAKGGKAAFVATDSADPEGPARIARGCLDKFGRIDLLVNAAASTERAGILDATADFIDDMFATNVRGPLLLMREAGRAMRDAGRGGAMVNILSMNAHGGTPELAVYSGTKAAMATLTRNAAHTLRNDRIRVNAVMLGWADTPGEHVVQEKTSPYGKDWLEHANESRPFGRLIQVDEIADLTAFLLSPHAGVMTGALVDYEQWVVGINPG
jgi:NAD(P)-dependent dehydrogenase (short-subunit alcohol dehydrogenase family)